MSDLVLLSQRRHHDDYPDVLLPHHPPEVSHGVVQGSLRADEVPLRPAALSKDIEALAPREDGRTDRKDRPGTSSHRHKVCVDVVGVGLGALKRQPHATVVICSRMEKQNEIGLVSYFLYSAPV